MPASFVIQLQHLRFFATHGMYAEEELAGGEFEVNIALTVAAPKATVSSLEETVNYAAVYSLAADVFSDRKSLLETLAMTIADKIKGSFPQVKSIAIEIVKLHPPIASFTGSVSVTYKRSYKVKG